MPRLACLLLLLPFKLHAATFEDALADWQERLAIPGIAWAVVRDGETVASGARGQHHDGARFTVDTPLRFASVSKAFAGTLLAIADAEGRLDLDESACRRIAALCDQPEITLRQLAAHVSEGEPGTVYVYGTARFALLEHALVGAFEATDYRALLRERILTPAGMAWHDSPQLGAHAGLVSTVSDMARFVAAFQGGALERQDLALRLEPPFELNDGSKGPASLGWFSQRIGDTRVLWSFGQDDPDHSSTLLLRIPERKIGFVLLANTDALSNPFRLLMGDVRYSPFAAAFLDAYAPAAAGAIPERIRAASGILADAFSERYEQATASFRAWETGPGRILDPDDLVAHFMVTSVAGVLESERFTAFDDAVTARYPANRWVLLASGEYRSAIGDEAIAVARFETILALPDQSDDFLGRLFRAWAHRGLASTLAEADPLRARTHVEAGLATGVGGETARELAELARELR